jgi:hypothetical protein
MAPWRNTSRSRHATSRRCQATIELIAPSRLANVLLGDIDARAPGLVAGDGIDGMADSSAGDCSHTGMGIPRKFDFDTALTSSAYGLPSLLAFADPTHITFGSDWRYANAERSAMFIRVLDDYGDIDHDGVNRGNAELLLPRLSQP